MPFVQAVHAYLEAALRAAFELGDQAVVSGGWDFSLVTLPPAELTLRQRMPHVDSTHPGKLALLLYLAPTDQGGTGFYRHRTTRYETITEDRFDRYEFKLKAELASLGEPSGYICGDTEMFERIANYDAVFNRMLVYRSRNLHAASLGPGFVGSDDPRTGRLTLNLFLHFQPRSPTSGLGSGHYLPFHCGGRAFGLNASGPSTKSAEWRGARRRVVALWPFMRRLEAGSSRPSARSPWKRGPTSGWLRRSGGPAPAPPPSGRQGRPPR